MEVLPSMWTSKMKKEELQKIIDQKAIEVWEKSQDLMINGEVFQKLLFQNVVETVLIILELQKKVDE